MPAAKMTETLQLPALQVPEQQVAECGHAWSSSSTPTLRRRRFRMRRARNVQDPSLETAPSSKEFLQLPSIEITPSSDEDTPWSNCSTPSASPRRKRFLLRKWLNVREKKECSESRFQIHPVVAMENTFGFSHEIPSLSNNDIFGRGCNLQKWEEDNRSSQGWRRKKQQRLLVWLRSIISAEITSEISCGHARFHELKES
uniref:GRAM domain containing 1B n=1 Tax=Podarcis muralis TaxID=64176 RepID=A0A670K9Z1_PODMU